MSFDKIINIIRTSFKVNKKIRIFSFYNKELHDLSDFRYLEEPNEKNKIIFFTTNTSNNYDICVTKCFNFIEKIGEGGFGCVYLAEQKFSHYQFAIKILKIKPSKFHSFQNWMVNIFIRRLKL